MEKISWPDHVRNEEVLLTVFKYLSSMLTDDGRCTCEIKSRIATAKAAFNKNKNLFTGKLDLNLRKKLVKFYVWTDHVRNEEVLLRVKEQRNTLHEIRKGKANWIGHILRRNCLLKQVIEGKIKGQIEVTRRQGRRHKKLLDDLKDRRGYCQLKEEAPDHTMWRNRFGGGFGPVV